MKLCVKYIVALNEQHICLDKEMSVTRLVTYTDNILQFYMKFSVFYMKFS